MDSLKFLLYTLARIGLLIACAAFSVFVGMVICPAIVSLLPDGSVREALINDALRSFISFAVVLLMLLPVFADDGKKHAAYEIWSSVNITITLIFMVMVYFIPSIFRDSFEPHGKANAFFEIAYFPFEWIQEKLGMDFVLSVFIGLAVIAALLLWAYVAAFRKYGKEHPFILGGAKRGESKIVREEEEEIEEVNLLNE
ncbi:MAG: hypothetical protein IJ561_08440 [Ruminococcus sp.]|nr:hypothetical protein [Ruminococcus sp.]